LDISFENLTPERLKFASAVLSGVVSCATASTYAYQIHWKKVPVNLATWAMIMFLDVVGLALVVLEGNKEPYMQVGWVVAAFLIMIAAVVNRGDWKWGPVESWATAICTLSALVWAIAKAVDYDARWAIAGYLVACYVSVAPQAIEYWEKPGTGRSSAWLWLWGIPITVMGALGSKEYTPEYLAVPVALLGLNAGMAWLTLRKGR
jgi:hypothetical protein